MIKIKLAVKKKKKKKNSKCIERWQSIDKLYVGYTED